MSVLSLSSLPYGGYKPSMNISLDVYRCLVIAYFHQEFSDVQLDDPLRMVLTCPP